MGICAPEYRWLSGTKVLDLAGGSATKKRVSSHKSAHNRYQKVSFLLSPPARGPQEVSLAPGSKTWAPSKEVSEVQEPE